MALTDGNGLSVADAIALQDTGRYNDGMFGGGNSWWVLFLFFLMAGGGGWGGWGNNAATQGALTRAELSDGFTMNNIERQIQGVQNGLCDGFYAMNTTNLQGFNALGRDVDRNGSAIQSAIANLGYQTQQCCCDLSRSIDSVKYENSQNTCDIIRNNDANTQRIIDVLTNNTIQDLRDNLQSAQLQLSNLSQTQRLIETLQPTSKPAYITCSPYASALPYGFNNYGCGCGCN